jgi:hypothetical protein
MQMSETSRDKERCVTAEIPTAVRAPWRRPMFTRHGAADAEIDFTTNVDGVFTLS